MLVCTNPEPEECPVLGSDFKFYPWCEYLNFPNFWPTTV